MARSFEEAFNNVFKPVEIPTEFKQAMFSVWNSIAPDLDTIELTNQSAIEICLDRLDLLDNDVASKQYQKMVHDHGFLIVYKALLETVRLV